MNFSAVEREGEDLEGKRGAMPVARRETSDGRVIGHVDMDCFYVQGLTFYLLLLFLGFHSTTIDSEKIYFLFFCL